jgi:hypothetical protein
MISGVIFVLLGEAILATSLPLLGWFILFVIGNAVYIPLAEEPGLVKRFGADYLTYKQNVPRWIPRLRAWEGGESAPTIPEGGIAAWLGPCGRLQEGTWMYHQPATAAAASFFVGTFRPPGT